MDEFDFFPELKETVAEPQVQYDSEEDALDAAVLEKQDHVIFDDTPDPEDPTAFREMFPAPIPDPCNASLVEKDSVPGKSILHLKEMRRMAFAFLAAKDPDAAGMSVASGISGITLDAASVSFTSRRSGSAICNSKIVIVADSLKSCLMTAEKKDKLEQEKTRLLKKKTELESLARENEPWLNESFFLEAPDWHYEKTANHAYHRCLKKLERTEFLLSHSGKLERIMAEQIVNNYYLLLPDTVTAYDGVPFEWGILTASLSRKVKVVREAEPMMAKEDRMQHLVLQIACNTWKDSLFAKGITVRGNDLMYSAIPRKRPVKYKG